MCPLRVVLVFLSAMLAGFFVLRNLRGADDIHRHEEVEKEEEGDDIAVHNSIYTKVGSAITSGFWGFVDMASGRYLWRALVDGADKKTNKGRC